MILFFLAFFFICTRTRARTLITGRLTVGAQQIKYNSAEIYGDWDSLEGELGDLGTASGSFDL